MTQQTDVQPDPLIGATIAGKYKIVKLLGEGGMGCVYVGEQQMGTTVRKVAVKTLHKHLSQDPSIKQRFQREVGTVAGLEHPNTIQVFDFGTTDDGQLYIVMELVQGRSVADWLEKEGAMPPARVENIMKQVCGSLEEAHGKGIIHRDLKPDNVVLCERAGQKDWVEVLDFGIAKRSTEHDPNEAKLTQQGMVLGTPPYMSPEQFTGQPIDLRSDIYALGVMTYEMLTGRLPFEANTAWEWASQHMTAQPKALELQPNSSAIPEKMRHAVMRSLAKNKDERFTSVREFFDALSGGAAPVSAAAAASNPAAPPGRAKTEMAAPAVSGPMTGPGGPPGVGGTSPGMSAATPPYGPPPGPNMGPAAVPAAPTMNSAQQKSGGSGLIIGLAVAGVLLLGGAGIFALLGRKKPVVVDPTTTTTTASTTVATNDAPDAAATTTTDDPAGSVTGVAALTTPPPTVVHNNTTPNTAKPDAGHAAPIPTPVISKKDTAQCQAYRNAKAKNVNAVLLAKLLDDCQKSGGWY